DVGVMRPSERLVSPPQRAARLDVSVGSARLSAATPAVAPPPHRVRSPSDPTSGRQRHWSASARLSPTLKALAAKELAKTRRQRYGASSPVQSKPVRKTSFSASELAGLGPCRVSMSSTP